MPYTAFDSFSYADRPPEPGVYIGRALSDGVDRLVFSSGQRLCVAALDSWEGWLVDRLSKPLLLHHNLTVAPDLSSAFDPQHEYTAHGTLTMSDTQLSIYLNMYDDRIASQRRIIVGSDDATLEPATVAFSRWAVMNGLEPLIEFDVGRPTHPVR